MPQPTFCTQEAIIPYNRINILDDTKNVIIVARAGYTMQQGQRKQFIVNYKVGIIFLLQLCTDEKYFLNIAKN